MKKNIYKIIVLSLLLTPGGAAAEDARTRLVGDGWFEMPFRPSQQNPQGEYIYFVGGYNSDAYAIKLSAKNFGFEDNKKIVPLYAAFCI